MYLRKISVPSHLKFASEFKELRAELEDVFTKNSYKRFFIVSGKKTYNTLSKELFKSLSKKHKGEINVFDDNSISTTEDVESIAQEIKPDVIVGVGGGKILDIAKYASSKTHTPFISIPTQVSHDGICSPVAIIKDIKGKSMSLGASIPIGVIVPLYIVKRASHRSTAAGVGDLLSNLTAVRDWQIAAQFKGEKYDDYAAILAHTAASSVYTLYNNRKEKIKFTEEFITRLVEGLILSGVAMEISGNSRPCSGSEHKISHAIDALYGSPALHGEQVALGVLAASCLQGNDYNAMRTFFSEAGLPTHPSEINLSLDQMVEAICYAPRTRPDRFTVLEQLKINKRLAAKTVKKVWGTK
ncbi:MAG: iron-containing alcohol dehydrogenase family protein [Candidatus Schekmanbacteria bacterium]|nr:iron-containing alcohol dehydrogenase family protein [Candidatus Schekmanbacteria bacterium]